MFFSRGSNEQTCISGIVCWSARAILYVRRTKKQYVSNTKNYTCVCVCFVLFSVLVCAQLLSASKVTLRLTVVRRWLCQMFLIWWEGRMKKQLSVQIRERKRKPVLLLSIGSPMQSSPHSAENHYKHYIDHCYGNTTCWITYSIIWFNAHYIAGQWSSNHYNIIICHYINFDWTEQTGKQ